LFIAFQKILDLLTDLLWILQVDEMRPKSPATNLTVRQKIMYLVTEIGRGHNIKKTS